MPRSPRWRVQIHQDVLLTYPAKRYLKLAVSWGLRFAVAAPNGASREGHPQGRLTTP